MEKMSDEMDRALTRSPSLVDNEEDEEDWDIPLAFSAERHTEKIEGLEDVAQTWRLKDRVTVPLLSIDRFVLKVMFI